MSSRTKITIPTASVSTETAEVILNTWPRFLTTEQYMDVLHQMISKAKFKINKDNSALLFKAFNNNDGDVIQVLFDHGAKIHDGKELYTTIDRKHRILDVFNKRVSLLCEKVLLDHILKEDHASKSVIFAEIQRYPGNLHVLNRATPSYTDDYKKDFAQLCVLARTFPATPPELCVLHECHRYGMTHPTYASFIKDCEEDEDFDTGGVTDEYCGTCRIVKSELRNSQKSST